MNSSFRSEKRMGKVYPQTAGGGKPYLLGLLTPVSINTRSSSHSIKYVTLEM